MGENITTEHIDLMNLPFGTQLKIGPEVLIKLSGVRNPCAQLEGLQTGLMKALLVLDENEKQISKAGVMGIIKNGGIVSTGDKIEII